mmetsp:Transcript_55781/g.92287  ORF Transcript_55781/g.92287 Transcript_55781/m.92287 type:complete len:249 (-) Transcript_55781:245-991(-)
MHARICNAFEQTCSSGIASSAASLSSAPSSSSRDEAPSSELINSRSVSSAPDRTSMSSQLRFGLTDTSAITSSSAIGPSNSTNSPTSICPRFSVPFSVCSPCFVGLRRMCIESKQLEREIELRLGKGPTLSSTDARGEGACTAEPCLERAGCGVDGMLTGVSSCCCCWGDSCCSMSLKMKAYGGGSAPPYGLISPITSSWDRGILLPLPNFCAFTNVPFTERSSIHTWSGEALGEAFIFDDSLVSSSS